MNQGLQVFPVHLKNGLKVLFMSNGTVVLDAKEVGKVQVEHFNGYTATITPKELAVYNDADNSEGLVYPYYKMITLDRYIKKWLKSYDLDFRRFE